MVIRCVELPWDSGWERKAQSLPLWKRVESFCLSFHFCAVPFPLSRVWGVRAVIRDFQCALLHTGILSIRDILCNLGTAAYECAAPYLHPRAYAHLDTQSAIASYYRAEFCEPCLKFLPLDGGRNTLLVQAEVRCDCPPAKGDVPSNDTVPDVAHVGPHMAV